MTPDRESAARLRRVRAAAVARKRGDAAFKQAVADAYKADGVTLGELAEAAGITKQGVLALLSRLGAR